MTDYTDLKARLREVLNYGSETGIFTWRKTVNSRAVAGSRAGSVMTYKCGKQYRFICVFGKKYKAARLAYFWMVGRWPEPYVDHIDGDGMNDAWANLREATPSQNQINRVSNKGTTQYRGVFRTKKSRNFQVQIQVNRKRYYLGGFQKVEDAARAYDDAAVKYHGSFARLNFPERYEG